MMSPVMWLHSTKFDGSLHYRHAVTPVRRDDGFLAVYLRLGERLESYRGVQIHPHHELGLYWADRHYNVWVVWREDWRPHRYYVNIATPATWSDGTLRCVDLDLDLLLESDGREPRLDDEDEFAEHSRRWGYPPPLLATCHDACREVATMMRQRDWPFDGRLFDWRPGGPWPNGYGRER
jgi:uncharacterized protein